MSQGWDLLHSLKTFPPVCGEGSPGPVENSADMSRTEMLKTHFDRLAREWTVHYQAIHPAPYGRLLRRRKAIALDYIRQHLPPGSRLLDVGCATGEVSLALARADYRVQGYDLAPDMISLAQEDLAGENSLDCSFECADVLKAGLPKRSFDGIVALAFLELQENAAKTLAILSRLLKPGGFMVLSVPNTVGVDRMFGLSRAAEKLTGRPRGLELHCFTVERIQRLLGMAGFIMMAYQRHGFVSADGHSELAIPAWADRLANEIVTCSRTYRTDDLEP